jgi:hypothetical protein
LPTSDLRASSAARPARLRRAEDTYAPHRLTARTAAVPVAEWAFHRYPPIDALEEADLSRRGQTDSTAQVTAEVNQGRWVGRCPFCPSAQVVTPDDPRFLCAGADGCANAPVRGAFVAVVFPPASVQDDVEAALMPRPTENRNWRRGETPADLREENAAHGLDNA